MIEFRGRPTTGRPKKASYREGRKRQINIRLSDDDIRHLDKLALYYGLTRTDLILYLVEENLKEIRRKK